MLCEDDKIPAGSKYKAFGELLRSKPASEPEPFNGADCNETGWLCYSSGTTGLPKGVMTTQLNFVAQLIVGSVAFPPQVSGRDSALCFLPLSHMYGLYVTLFQPIMWGTFAVVLPRFDEIQVLTAIEKVRQRDHIHRSTTDIAVQMQPCVLGAASFTHPRALDQRAKVRHLLAPYGAEWCRGARTRARCRIQEAIPSLPRCPSLRHD